MEACAGQKLPYKGCRREGSGLRWSVLGLAGTSLQPTLHSGRGFQRALQPSQLWRVLRAVHRGQEGRTRVGASQLAGQHCNLLPEASRKKTGKRPEREAGGRVRPKDGQCVPPHQVSDPEDPTRWEGAPSAPTRGGPHSWPHSLSGTLATPVYPGMVSGEPIKRGRF